MEARKLKPGEQYFSHLNMAVAFESGFDLEQARAKAGEEKEDPREDHWAAFPEGEKYPAASLVMNKLDVRFEGRVVKLGGVGGVATLPAQRRGGAIRACMRASFRDLYDSGFLLSALYPFSTAYYRQFGFENSRTAVLWTLPLSDLKVSDPGGRVRQLFPGDDLSPLLRVYNDFYANVNLSAVREVYDAGLEKDNLLEQKRYIFVWEDETGRPGAFLIGGRDGDTLNCRTDFSARNGLLFRDARSLQGLLAFVRRAFAANFQSIRFAVPSFIDITSLVPEIASAERSLFCNGMLRLVNVEAALGMCRCRGEGTLTLAVTDPLLPENNGVFRLSFAPETENRVERLEASAVPDVSLGVGDLSVLLCGVRNAEELPWMPEVRVENPEAPFERAFYSKPCHILDLF